MPMRSCECVKQIHMTRALYASHAWWVHNFPRLQRSKFLTKHVEFCFAEKDLFSCYIKQIMNVFFIRAMEQIFSFGERWNVPFNEANISSFTSWKYLYHWTHKHSLFVYYLYITVDLIDIIMAYLSSASRSKFMIWIYLQFCTALCTLRW